ncbi:MAG: hypothetical protein HJJLKODD_00832 [Phycisphaerae bacterium]|nr:hypothetical protein [Phycisphaerae bacterium]
MSCIEQALRIEAMVWNRLGEAEQSLLFEHMTGCDLCRKKLEQALLVTEYVQLARQIRDAHAIETPALFFNEHASRRSRLLPFLSWDKPAKGAFRLSRKKAFQISLSAAILAIVIAIPVWLSWGPSSNDVFAQMVNAIPQYSSVQYLHTRQFKGKTFEEHCILSRGGRMRIEYGRGYEKASQHDPLAYISDGRYCLSYEYPLIFIRDFSMDRMLGKSSPEMIIQGARRKCLRASEFLGEQMIGQHKTVGYVVTLDLAEVLSEEWGQDREQLKEIFSDDVVTYHIWMDVKTGMPERIETYSSMEPEATEIQSDFVWNEPLSPDLFSIDIPENTRWAMWDEIDPDDDSGQWSLVSDLKEGRAEFQSRYPNLKIQPVPALSYERVEPSLQSEEVFQRMVELLPQYRSVQYTEGELLHGQYLEKRYIIAPGKKVRIEYGQGYEDIGYRRAWCISDGDFYLLYNRRQISLHDGHNPQSFLNNLEPSLIAREMLSGRLVNKQFIGEETIDEHQVYGYILTITRSADGSDSPGSYYFIGDRIDDDVITCVMWLDAATSLPVKIESTHSYLTQFVWNQVLNTELFAPILPQRTYILSRSLIGETSQLPQDCADSTDEEAGCYIFNAEDRPEKSANEITEDFQAKYPNFTIQHVTE